MPSAPRTRRQHHPPSPATYDRHRGSRHVRGYTNSWIDYSSAFRREHPLCEQCLVNCRVVAAACVDHIVPVIGADDPLFWDATNHQSLCRRCHAFKTAKYDGGFGNKKREPVSGRFVVTGLPASGKSFWARANASAGEIVWDADAEAARMFYIPPRAAKTDEQWKALMQARERCILSLEQNTHPAIIIAVNRADAATVARRIGAELVIIACDEDERQRRLRERVEIYGRSQGT